MTWQVEGYTELRELGSGAQGRVVLARQDGSGVVVAIKYVTATGQMDGLRAEAQMLARVADPHVATLYQLVTGEQGAALVMEAVDGVSLRTILDRFGAMAPEGALLILKGSLLGLAAAHEVGVVHRDYKPANVVVQADGLSKLIDFGIAGLAGTGSRSGTPAYMAPEQWEGLPASPATDVYAAACVFFECVAGRRPYEAESEAALKRAHLSGRIPVDAVPEQVQPLVLRGMAADPAARPAGAAAFVTELETTAAQAYGPDWERRGVAALSGAAAALAALFPLAAVATAVGGAAAPVVAGAGGVSGAVSGAGALLGALGGKAAVALAAGATSVAATAGAVVYRQLGDDQPAARVQAPPSRSAQRVPQAAQPVARTAVRDCPNVIFAASPIPRPSFRLPRQVKLPAGAAVYEPTFEGAPQFGLFIGPASGDCGVTGGDFTIATAGKEPFQVWKQADLDTVTCQYFPDSPQAEAIRRAGTSGLFCPAPERLRARQALPIGAQDWRGVLARADPERAGRVSVMLLLLSPFKLKTDVYPLIGCTMPSAKAALCTAALTYHFIENTAVSGITQATLNADLQRIAGYVLAARR